MSADDDPGLQPGLRLQPAPATGVTRAVHRIAHRRSGASAEGAHQDERSTAISIWNVHYNYHRPHSGGQPPVTRLKTGVTNVQPSYS